MEKLIKHKPRTRRQEKSHTYITKPTYHKEFHKQIKQQLPRRIDDTMSKNLNGFNTIEAYRNHAKVARAFLSGAADIGTALVMGEAGTIASS